MNEVIEKFAFKDRETLSKLNELDLLVIIEFLQLDRKQWINQYTSIHNDYVDLQQENQELNKQLEYLRSGEYLNQLKFERNMLEDIVQNMEVSKEDKEFIDMTHRNTELLEENHQLKEVIDDEYKYLKQERENHFNNVKLCTTNLENLILSSALCTCDHALEILNKVKGEENENN